MTVTARRQHSMLSLTVADDGPGFGPEQVTEGIGLANTRARLQQLYGAAQAFEYRSGDNGGAVVTIALPWRSDQRLKIAV
jgi:signal transduction histidine kinase